MKTGSKGLDRETQCAAPALFSPSKEVRPPNETERAALLVEDAKIRESLRKIVGGFTTDPALQQDMLQECLVCLWKVQREKPGRTRSWYLQNCRFRVQHWLALGRSVDSPKRGAGDKRIMIEGHGDETALEDYHTNGELFDTVSFQDLVLTLGRYLKPRERDVLGGLADGLVLREIAFKFKLSYPTALKYRRKIAALTVKLGVTPVQPCEQHTHPLAWTHPQPRVE